MDAVQFLGKPRTPVSSSRRPEIYRPGAAIRRGHAPRYAYVGGVAVPQPCACRCCRPRRGLARALMSLFMPVPGPP